MWVVFFAAFFGFGVFFFGTEMMPTQGTKVKALSFKLYHYRKSGSSWVGLPLRPVSAKGAASKVRELFWGCVFGAWAGIPIFFSLGALSIDQARKVCRSHQPTITFARR